MKIWVEEFLVGPLQMRCSIVTRCDNGATIVIDGGDEPERLINWVENWDGLGPDDSSGPTNLAESEEQGFAKRRVVAFVNTHAHFDHSGQIPVLMRTWDVPFWLHKGDHELQAFVRQSAARWGFSVPEPALPTDLLEHGVTYDFDGLAVEVRHSPGHSLGSVCLIIEGEEVKHAFVGDVLFAGGVGRTDLPNSGGSWPLLKKSIEEQLLTLPDNTIVYPGHGPTTTIGREKQTNPYLT